MKLTIPDSLLLTAIISLLVEPKIRVDANSSVVNLEEKSCNCVPKSECDQRSDRENGQVFITFRMGSICHSREEVCCYPHNVRSRRPSISTKSNQTSVGGRTTTRLPKFSVRHPSSALESNIGTSSTKLYLDEKTCRCVLRSECNQLPDTENAVISFRMGSVCHSSNEVCCFPRNIKSYRPSIFMISNPTNAVTSTRPPKFDEKRSLTVPESETLCQNKNNSTVTWTCTEILDCERWHEIVGKHIVCGKPGGDQEGIRICCPKETHPVPNLFATYNSAHRRNSAEVIHKKQHH